MNQKNDTNQINEKKRSYHKADLHLHINNFYGKNAYGMPNEGHVYLCTIDENKWVDDIQINHKSNQIPSFDTTQRWITLDEFRVCWVKR